MGRKDTADDTSKRRWIPVAGSNDGVTAPSKSDPDVKPAAPLKAAKKEPSISEANEKLAANGQPALKEAIAGNERPVVKERTASSASSSSASSSSASARVAGEGEGVERKRGILDRLSSLVHPKIAAATLFAIVLLTTQ